MTIESYQTFCTSNDYALAGLEYASQCYCSNDLTSPSTLGDAGCTFSCSGAAAEICGGSDGSGPGFLWAGVENGRECYCGTLPEDAVMEQDVGHETCSMLYVGDDKEYCGAGSLLNVF